MEDDNLESDLLGTVLKPPSVRVTRSFKNPSLSKFSPQNSPSFRRGQSIRTPRKELQGTPLAPISVPTHPKSFLRYSSRRLLPWLILITIWVYAAVFFLSRKNPDEEITLLGFKFEKDEELRQLIDFKAFSLRRNVNVGNQTADAAAVLNGSLIKNGSHLGEWAKDWLWGGKEDGLYQPILHGQPSKQKDLNVDRQKSLQVLRQFEVPNFTQLKPEELEALQEKIFSLGKYVGPYDTLEKQVLGTSERIICKLDSKFAKVVRGKSVVVLFHELSMTGSPLSMLELAEEAKSCGAKVSAIILNMNGGLLTVILKKGISLIRGKSASSWRAAARADIVVAGSSVCASWIEKYFLSYRKGRNRIVWWVMENRKEYFDRSKHMLRKVAALVFLSEIQAKQWQEWSRQEGITLPSKFHIVGLSVNDKIASAAELELINNPKEQRRKMALMHDQVRSDMGLEPEDMLFASLSSINPGKGQLIMLYAALLTLRQLEGGITGNYDHALGLERGKEILEKNSTKLPNLEGLDSGGDTRKDAEPFTKFLGSPKQSNNVTFRRAKMKLLIGSVGSKSNKLFYVQKIFQLLDQNHDLAKLVIWTPATVHVSSLYSGADVYVMNAQGIGETFGRVTIEAMAFGLPVLGTSAGGTSEIVDNNTTGLLHPVGVIGAIELSEHMIFMLNNPRHAKSMGEFGRAKVHKLYTKSMMYDKLAGIFANCTY